MKFKRRVLSALVKDLLLEISRILELDVTSRMGGEDLRGKSKCTRLKANVRKALPRYTLNAELVLPSC